MNGKKIFSACPGTGKKPPLPDGAPDWVCLLTGVISLQLINKHGDLWSKAPTGLYRRLRTLETSEIIMTSEITHDYWISLHGLTFDQRPT